MVRRLRLPLHLVIGIGFLVIACPIGVGTENPPFTSNYTLRGPIEVTSNEGFTPANGVIAGTGSPADPYLIEGWEIVAYPFYGILVANVDAHFTIRNVWIHSGGSTADGIRLGNVRNGTIENVLVSGNRNGVYVLESSESVTIREITADGNGVGVVVVGTKGVVIRNNTLTRNGEGILVSLSGNTHVEENRLYGGLRGIRVFSSSNISMLGNNVTQATFSPVLVQGATLGRVLNNFVDGGGWGVAIESSSAFLVEGNVVSGALTGISISQSGDVLVRGNELNATKTAAIAVGANSGNVTVEANAILESGGGGIVVSYVDRTLIKGNIVRAPGGSGVTVVGASNVEILSNVVEGSPGEGIILLTTTDGQVRENELTLNHEGLVVRDCARLEIISNLIERSLLQAIFLVGATDVTVRENQLTLNGRGLIIHSSERAQVEANTIAGDLPGISIEESVQVTVVANTLTSSGIVITGSKRSAFTSHSVGADNTVDGNPVYFVKERSDVHIDGGQWGQIIIVGSENIAISNVSISGTYVALEIGHVRNATVVGSVFGENRLGLAVFFSSEVVLARNNFSANAVGLWLWELSTARIFHNNFLNNTLQVQTFLAVGIEWDAGYPLGGNYWSDYLGIDRCSGPDQDSCNVPDGIGDQAHGIPVADGPEQFDRYPWVNPLGAGRKPSPPIADWILPVALAVVAAVGLTASAVILFLRKRRPRA